MIRSLIKKNSWRLLKLLPTNALEEVCGESQNELMFREWDEIARSLQPRIAVLADARGLSLTEEAQTAIARNTAIGGANFESDDEVLLKELAEIS
ncbi:hypothetical protein IMZ31_22260 (plasmid) [Pontibacillus sp. ALD_SL1]|uniref:hypothetical protein n=1 Tax=Pontibacillus sp. ALD_SL1 TaxID=2777185 RepID=UPI001A978FDA|nr:hypothetical protein [Pontibacillus sp. ALD_SL1]QST02179.1 hypothetical protein IMZ31_22260 [Pontibacillus sp. ALD_SL1]